jgi:hypothetical protein
MRLVLMHLGDEPCAADEEAAFIIPGGERTAVMVPLLGLEQFVPVLLKALDDLPEQRCDACGESLAELPPMDLSGL